MPVANCFGLHFRPRILHVAYNIIHSMYCIHTMLYNINITSGGSRISRGGGGGGGGGVHPLGGAWTSDSGAFQ